MTKVSGWMGEIGIFDDTNTGTGVYGVATTYFLGSADKPEISHSSVRISPFSA